MKHKQVDCKANICSSAWNLENFLSGSEREREKEVEKKGGGIHMNFRQVCLNEIYTKNNVREKFAFYSIIKIFVTIES